MIQRFGRSVPEICMITSLVTDLLYDNHAHRVMQWNPYILSPENLQVYADAIHEKGAPLKSFFGFINGTVRPICRPQQHQRVVYNGHKRVHLLKFQCVALPNGIIAHIFGPVGKFVNVITQFSYIVNIYATNPYLGIFNVTEGKKHDAGMLADSNFLHQQEENAFSPDGNPM